jgi:hypothetical protein
VTWVIDPALIDAVRRIAEGNPPRSLEPNLRAGQADGEDTDSDATATPSESPSATETAESPTGQPQDSTDNPLDLDQLDPVVQAAAKAAQAWLARLGDAMRPEDQVLSLPYGDVDASAAATHDEDLLHQAVARAGTTLPGFDVTTSPVLSSPSGFLSSAGIAAAEPSSTMLLTDQMFDDPAPALAQIEDHDVVVTSTGAASGGPGPGRPDRADRDAAAAAVRGSRAVPPGRPTRH